MSLNLHEWPDWAWQTAKTVATLVIAYFAGHIINAVVVARVMRLTKHTRGHWEPVVVGEIKRRVPWLALLGGAWLSLGYWSLGPYMQAFTSGAIFALGVLIATLAIAGIATKLVGAYGPRHAPGAPVAALTKNVTRLVILVLGGLVILNGLGVSITPLLTALGVGGLAVALALQEPLSNLFAGLFLSISGQSTIGDFVKLDSGLEGYIVDVNWRSTKVQMQSGSVIIVPNAKLSQSIVTVVANHPPPSGDVDVAVDVGVASAPDLARLEAVTLDVARDVMRRVPGGVPEFEPTVRYRTLEQAKVLFSVILHAKQFADRDLVRHEFVKRLHDRYAREGVLLAPAPVAT
jgi:small-conductance mechanosensitive channel